MARDQRRLAAIVSADVAGYSRLMGLDESGTLAELKAHRGELIDPKIAEYGGRIVKTTGDGLLLEFPSVVEAVRCAVDVQRGMSERNAAVPPERLIEFRIGVNLGDIIIDGEDIYGDGVNVAARLQALAEPGEICVSKAVRDQVLDKLSFGFEDLGAQKMKNIARAVEAYRVDLGSESLLPHADPRTRWQWLTRRESRWIAASVLVLAVAGAAWWAHRPAPTVAAQPPPLSLLILPFAAPAGDAVLESIADTLGGEVTRAIANSWRDMKVVTPGVAAAYKGKPADARLAGREAGVRYVVEGDVRTAGEQIAATIVLIDTVQDKQLGSERRTVDRGRLTQDQGLLAARVAGATREMLRNANARRIAAEPVSATDARGLVERGSATFRFEDLASIRASRKLFREAIDKDPNMVTAWIWHGYTLYTEYWVDFAGGRNEQLLSDLDDDSRRALALDDRDIRAWELRGDALQVRWQFDAALEAGDRARDLDPTQAGRRLMNRMSLLVLMGRSEDALVHFAELNAMGAPPDSDGLRLACIAYVYVGRFEDAIASCERASVDSPDYWIYLVLTAAYAQTGDVARAEAAKLQMVKRVPDLTISRFLAKQFSNDPHWIEQIRTNVIPGLRKAGVPE